MPYFALEDFKSGLDIRRENFSAPAGTLSTLRNAHITAGGEIEKRLGFENTLTADPSVIGIATIRSTVFLLTPGTFGDTGAPSASPPSDTIDYVTYPVYPTTATAVPTSIVDWDIYDGRLYIVSLQVDTGTDVYVHQYDGAIVDLTTSTGLVPSDKPAYIRTFQTKIYAAVEDTLYFSSANDPKSWNGVGAGFIKLSTEDAEAAYSVGLEIYYDKLAIMSRYATQIWAMDTDPANNRQEQVLRNSGTLAPHSLRQYGSGDVLFLSDSGIRSMRAKDSSNSASVTDIGSPVDPIIRDLVRANGAAYLSTSRALIHPLTGRFWMVLPDRVMVLSYFPGPKVTAWSEYTMAFTLKDVAVAGSQIVVLDSENKIWLYGGVNRSYYDTSEVTVTTPFMHVERPANVKDFQGMDAALSTDGGSWQVSASYDPNNPDAKDVIANLTETTYPLGRVAMAGKSTHISLELKHTGPGDAVLGNLAVHYKTGEAD